MLRPFVVSVLGFGSACFASPPVAPEPADGASSSDGSSGGESDASTGSASSAAEDTAVDTDTGSSSTGAEGGSSDTTGSSDTHTTAPGVIGPLFPLDDHDDGAIFPDGNGYGAHWYPSGEGNGAGEQYLGQFPASKQYYAYLRFTLPEALPAGSSVAEAVLVLHGHDAYSWDGTHALRVWAQHSDDAPAVSDVSHYPGTSIELIETSVRWPEELGLAWQYPGANESSDLAALVQALVDEYGGLAAGAHVQLWVGMDLLDGTGEEVGWLDSVAGPRTAPSLTITLAEG